MLFPVLLSLVMLVDFQYPPCAILRQMQISSTVKHLKVTDFFFQNKISVMVCDTRHYLLLVGAKYPKC